MASSQPLAERDIADQQGKGAYADHEHQNIEHRCLRMVPWPLVPTAAQARFDWNRTSADRTTVAQLDSGPSSLHVQNAAECPVASPQSAAAARLRKWRVPHKESRRLQHGSP